MAIKTVTYSKDKKLSAHFSLKEFKCSASNTIKYSEETIALLEKVFDKCPNISKAIITSGYRTPEYSVSIGGTKDDGHTVGIAVDSKWYDKDNNLLSPKYIACIAQDLGFTGIGIMKTSIHLDTRTTKNYKNGKWWGDETNGKSGITDFYSYFKLSKAEVYKVLGIENKTAVEPKKTDIIEVKEESKAEETKTETTAEDMVKENANVIVRFFKFLIELFNKIKGEQK